EIEIVNRPLVRKGDLPPEQFRVYRQMPMTDGKAQIAPMAVAGEGYRFHVTGLTHDERGYPAMYADASEQNIQHLVDKILTHRNEIIQLEEHHLDDAEVVVVSYGISARTSLWPIEQARKEGIRVGYLRLITVWPFPEDRIRRLAKKIRAFVVPEINRGQIIHEVERCAAGRAQVSGVNRLGGDILEPRKVLKAIRAAAGQAATAENDAAGSARED
ncbi:MAG: transketolase C-terminal domain-containing protein, partial [Planctomycetota bacterium]